MSDDRAGERTVLNWRGPLLAAALFAAVFGVLLLMAQLNRSKTSDEGSSFRQDPYGTSLLFDAYERAGYHVKRSQDEKSLGDEDAARTTAFFIGGNDYGDFSTRDGKMIMGAKFHRLLEEFLGRGGRVVLLEQEPGISVASIPKADEKLADEKPKSSRPLWQKEETWGVEKGSDSSKHDSGPAWAGPSFPAMPTGSEMMYLAADFPWLKLDEHWTTLYAGQAKGMDESAVEPKTDRAAAKHVYMAMRRVGDGELVAASQQSFLLNETIKIHPSPVLLDFLAGGRPVIWLDETLHGLHQEEGVLWLVQRYRLQTALLLFWATLLVLLWSMSGDLVRRPAGERGPKIIHHGGVAGLAGQRLLQRSVASEQVVAECWEQFRRRSPLDAEAISRDARWGPRLRTALAQSPLTGYKELKHLIAERRTFAKGLAVVDREVLDRPVTAPKTTSEEAQTA